MSDPVAAILRQVADFLDSREYATAGASPKLTFTTPSIAQLQAQVGFMGTSTNLSLKDLQILFGGNKINAIKQIRDVCRGMGLREAKEFVEEVTAGIHGPTGLPGASW
jgi:ribosomal protein L7/L12